MAEWKIKTENEDEEYPEDSEIESEDFEQESEPLENIIQGGSSGTSLRSNKQEISPFLESEPIENLEQDLEQTPTENQEENKEIETPMLYNAPQYSGSYESGDYENTRKTADTQLDISGGALTTRETAIHTGEQRMMNFNAWQQQNMDQVQTQGEKYQVGKTERFKQQDDLPFQGQEKPRRFN
jgi:hypothetical protein